MNANFGHRLRSRALAITGAVLVASTVLPGNLTFAMSADPPALNANPGVAPDTAQKKAQAFSARSLGALSDSTAALSRGAIAQADLQPNSASGLSSNGGAKLSAAAVTDGLALPAAQTPRLAQPAQTRGATDEIIPNQLIVTYKSNAAFKANTAVVPGQAVNTIKENNSTSARLVQVADVKAAKSALQTHADVASVEENRIAKPQYSHPNNGWLPWQWHLFPYPGSNVGSYNSSAAWDLTWGNPNNRIAFLDTGMDWNHPGLSPKHPLGYNFAESNYNWGDCNGHGTATAGTAAAAANSGLTAGVDLGVSLYEAKIVTGCSGSSDYFTMGWALNTVSSWSGTRVVNISFGGYGYSSYLCQAVSNALAKNVVVVASAGNDNVSAPLYPAACSGTIAVGATDQSGAKASFSNFGWPDVYVSAPGVNILTTNAGGGYGYWNGTSFSAPIVAGIASLTAARYPGISQATIRSWMGTYAYNPDCGWGCWTPNHGYGIPNAYSVAI